MLSNLAKTPLLAVIFAAMLTFMTALLPGSSGYLAAQEQFAMPLWGYLLTIAWGLWLALVMAMLYYHAKSRKKIIFALFVFFPVLILMWLQPMLEQLMFGQPAQSIVELAEDAEVEEPVTARGRTSAAAEEEPEEESVVIMTRFDTLMKLAAGAVCVLIILILALLLFQNEGKDPAYLPGYKIRIVPLIIKVVCSPFAFCILFTVAWYFLGWKHDPVRIYYSGGAEALDEGFVIALINLLLNNIRIVPYSLLMGLLYTLMGIPLAIQLAGKRLWFLVIHSMLYLSGALFWAIPDAAWPDAVRMWQLIRFAALLLVYSIINGFLLHTSFRRIEPAAAPAQKKEQAPGRPAAPRPAAARR